MKRKLRVFLSMLLSVLMIATSFPSFVFADNLDTPEGMQTEDLNATQDEENDKEDLHEEKEIGTEGEIESEAEGETEETGENLDLNMEISPFSLLPIDEVRAKLDLREFLPAEIRSMKISDVLGLLTDYYDGNPIVIDPSATTVWSTFKDADGDILDYVVTGMDEYVDMSRNYYNTYYNLELIVGSGNQLDIGNIRYLVEVSIPSEIDFFDFEIYTQSESQRTKVNHKNSYSSRDIDGENIFVYYLRVPKSVYSKNPDYYAGIKLAEKYKNYDISLYEGFYDTAGEAIEAGSANPALDVTSSMYNQTMNEIDAGLVRNYTSWRDIAGFTAVIKRDGDIVGISKFSAYIIQIMDEVGAGGIYKQKDDGTKEYVGGSTEWDYSDNYDTEIITYSLPLGYEADAEYYYNMSFYDGETDERDNSKVIKAVAGHYDSLEAASGQTEIKSKLFTDDIYAEGEGYKANFSGNGIDFTVFSENDVWKFTIKVVESDMDESPDLSEDRYFRVTGVVQEDERLDSYVVPHDVDSYYEKGYQALLINDETVDLSSLKPIVTIGYKAKVFIDGVQEELGSKESNIELSARDFSQEPKDSARDPKNSVKYTVSAENHFDHKNYWVTMVKKVADAQLFVNGPDEREVFLDNYYGHNHDIFIANIGNSELTGIEATLNATHVKLDKYWTVGGDGNNSLAAFTETYASNGNYHGELFNVAKIRIVPDGEGEIKGTLTVSADGQEPRIINIKGFAGNPKIDTESLREAVKYVPYSSIITTNNIHDWNKVTFRLEDGKLPEGVELLPSGELYGVPRETGDFQILVCADFSHNAFEDSYAAFTLTVNENTDENVNNATDDGYGIEVRVPDMTEYADTEFKVEGVIAEFIDFWLDGKKLVKNVDYSAEEGSTKITIRSQTFSNAGNGKHTIAAEFRIDGNIDNELKRSAQNYNMDRSGGGSGGSSGGGNKTVDESYDVKFVTNGGSAIGNLKLKKGDKLSGIGTPVREGFTFAGWFKDAAFTKPADMNGAISESLTLYAKWVENAPVVPDNPPENAGEFADIEKNAWYYADVDWAYKNGLMVGINNLLFSPDAPITQSMVVTVLARLSNEDLSMYESGSTSEEAWYTKFELWAKSVGLLEGIEFKPNMALSREDMAVILVRYIKYSGINYAVTDEYIEFADENFISEHAKDALQILFKLGIFKGKGNQVIDPASSTTRAELTALLHRIALLIETQN